MARDPKRDCAEPKLFDLIWEEGSGRWTDIDAEAAAAECGIRPQSVIAELQQMAKRGTIDLFYVPGVELAAKPLHERTYSVSERSR